MDSVSFNLRCLFDATYSNSAREQVLSNIRVDLILVTQIILLLVNVLCSVIAESNAWLNFEDS